MRRTDPTEQALNILADLRRTPDPSAAGPQLRAFLRNRSNLVVAKAAKVCAELRLAELAPDLTAAFDRLMADPAKLDKRCAAATEIAAALYTLDYTDADVYLRGIRHIQMEASYGPPVDAAVQLRAHCALGLIRTRHPDAISAIVDLMGDREPAARAGAARALSAIGDTGALLLRLKVLTGDRETEVVAECLAGMLRADADGALHFVARYLDAADESIAEAAVLALGACRTTAAIEALQEKWSRTASGPLRSTLLLALATARHEAAMDFLLKLVREESTTVAIEVIRALRVCRDDERVRDAARREVEQRGESALLEAFREAF
jgi:HEAT repeat protein